ncbi:MAG: hypothetical protein V4713_03795 [Pseudomonadota bacterium]
MATKTHPEPEGFFEEKASDALASRGLVLPESPTALEFKLMAHLLLICGAAERVLSDVDDDGVAEAADMAVLAMRKALLGQRLPKLMPTTPMKSATSGLPDRLTLEAELMTALAAEVRLAGSDFHADSLEIASKACANAARATLALI